MCRFQRSRPQPVAYGGAAPAVAPLAHTQQLPVADRFVSSQLVFHHKLPSRASALLPAHSQAISPLRMMSNEALCLATDITTQSMT
eukprot:590218-Amphidinium_carterae.1